MAINLIPIWQVSVCVSSTVMRLFVHLHTLAWIHFNSQQRKEWEWYLSINGAHSITLPDHWRSVVCFSVVGHLMIRSNYNCYFVKFTWFASGTVCVYYSHKHSGRHLISLPLSLSLSFILSGAPTPSLSLSFSFSPSLLIFVLVVCSASR